MYDFIVDILECFLGFNFYFFDAKEASRMKKIIETNRALFRRAQELNLRAGREVFPVPTRDELTEVLTQCLGGVARMGDITTPEALRLPALDKMLVEKVLAECPDQIRVLDRDLAIEYRVSSYGIVYPPRVTLPSDLIQANTWIKLPNEGVKLTDGRVVEVAVSFGYYNSFSSTDIPTFKTKVREHLNQGQWERWQKPTLAAPTDSIPPVVEMEYGQCVVTGIALVAYGTFRHDIWSGWVSHWSRDRAEVDKVHAQACAKFVEVKEKITRDALRKRVGDLYNTHDYNSELPQEMRNRLYNTYYGYSGGATTVAEIEAFIAEVEASLAAIEAAKAAEAARIAEAEKSGQLIRELKITCDTRYGRGRVWVIKPDGTLREHDTTDYAGRSRYTCYVWRMVTDELVLIEEVTSVEGVSNTLHGTGVLWKPASVTPAQLRAVEEIEGEHQLGGTFVVDPTQVARQAAMLDEICDAVFEIAPQEYFDDVTFGHFASEHGRQLTAVNAAQWVSRNKPSTHACEGREAQLAHSTACGGGTLEFLVYHKWGNWNMNARWRSQTEEERNAPPVVTQPPAPKGDGGTVSSSSLAALAAKFAKR